MVCPTCGLDNDPASTLCARCNSALTRQAPSHPPPIPPIPPSRSRRSVRIPLLAGTGVLLLMLAVAAGLYLRAGHDEPDPVVQASTRTVPATASATVPATEATTTPPPDPRAQARAVDAVLSDSVASRRKLNQAIERVGDCAGLSGAVADIRAVGEERQSQMDTVRDADLSALPDGETLRAALIEALRFAWEADQGFLAWAQPTLSGGCDAADDSGYARGRSASNSAGTAKRAFLAQWNPVARANGLSARSADEI
ncbi:hypothetical protein AB0G04_42165 [Actinoplanes sp. NPDC023801]|uniref:hypothetical protein n=1 Tax=Actinoplanes sp. NPDC023801 TaxID=3154595 RepID=UPI0033E8F74A